MTACPFSAPAAQANWAGSWEACPAPASLVDWSGSAGPPTVYQNQTLREIVHLTAGGSQVRVRLTNRYGACDLVIGAATIALRAQGSSVAPGSIHSLAFNGKPSVTIPAGADIYSDPVDLDAAPQSDLAVSLYLPGPSPAATVHLQQRSAIYVFAGNQVGASNFPPSDPSGEGKPWVWLDGVDVATSTPSPAIVAFGDSVTDGAQLTRDQAREWPTILSQRLQQAHRPGAVLDAGLSGNRLLHDGHGPGAFFGVSGLARFDSDVLAVSGVRSVFVLLGLNDIAQPVAESPETVSVDQITWGLTQLATRAHAHGLKIYIGTMTPFAGSTITNFYSPKKNQERLAVNAWIQGNTVFDGVADFAKIVADPQHPDQLLPAYDSGDHTHPSDAGARALASAIPLNWFK